MDISTTKPAYLHACCSKGRPATLWHQEQASSYTPWKVLLLGSPGYRPKVYETLKHLVEHPGRLIGKQELMHAVWPDAFVTDDSLV
jgi:DNA-binding response OmpR family regulator